MAAHDRHPEHVHDRRPRSRWWSALVVCVVLLGACGAEGGGSAAEPTTTAAAPALGGTVAAIEGAVATTGEYVVDSGFRPEPDGFSFANYANDGVTNLAAADLHHLFGDAICDTGEGPSCTLSSPAVTWMQQINAAMAGGHCEGLAVLSQLYHVGERDPSEHGAPRTYDLRLDDNAALQREIARWWATQATTPASTSRNDRLSPSGVVDELRRALAGEPGLDTSYTLAIFQPGLSGGHAITPYALEERGDGVVWIMVYDNNHPGVPRAVEVDTVADTWTYESSINPDQPESVYRGDASTNTLWLTPLTDRVQTQDCPFCAGELAGDLDPTNQLLLTGPGSRTAELDFYVTDPTGRTFGRRDGGTVQEIPEGRFQPLLAAEPDDAPAPLLEVPAAFDLIVTLRAPDGVAAQDMDLGMVGAGYDVLVDDIDLAPGETAQLFLSQDATLVGWTTERSGTPTLDVTTGDEASADGGANGGADYDVQVAAEMDEPGTLELTSPDDADVLVGVDGAAVVQLSALRRGRDGAERTVSGEVELQAGEQVVLVLEGWAHDEPLGLVVLRDGQVHRRLQLE